MVIASQVVEKEVIQQEIAILRNNLYELSRKVGTLSHPDLVKLSQLLDQKLNQLGRVV